MDQWINVLIGTVQLCWLVIVMPLLITMLSHGGPMTFGVALFAICLLGKLRPDIVRCMVCDEVCLKQLWAAFPAQAEEAISDDGRTPKSVADSQSE